MLEPLPPPLEDVFDVGFGHTFEERGHTFEAGFSFKNGLALDLGLADLAQKREQQQQQHSFNLVQDR
ncbi:hypothetical protein TYRP_011881 [Tyrophagus putrescentiae]|nr:hypothetical protein TYRP_011881 [Tyrophagus putrescentiae]